MATRLYKARVAAAVQAMLHKHIATALADIEGVVRVTVNNVTPLQSHVRVVTQSEGVHYYLVQVKEEM